MNKKNLFKEQRGSISYAIVFTTLFLVLILFFVFFSPMIQRMNVGIFQSAEGIMDESIANAQQIQDQNVRESYIGIFTAQKESFVGQADVLGTFTKYAWVIIALVLAFVLFLTVRRNVETQNIS